MKFGVETAPFNHRAQLRSPYLSLTVMRAQLFHEVCPSFYLVRSRLDQRGEMAQGTYDSSA